MAIVVHPEVEQAIASGRPVVALESTLISHGLPRPQNLAVAHGMADAVRSRGAVPAVTAVLDGAVRVGLEPREVDRLASGEPVAKCSTRDLALAIASGGLGATTVAATIYAAARVGIRVMATGGIGGVHRDFAGQHDVSADLAELARSKVAVVCSGAKSILDLPRTLEALESLGVPVIGIGSARLPAFYATDSGLAIPSVADARAAAALIRAHAALGWPSGIVLANPPPADVAMPREAMEQLIDTALRDAAERGVQGAAVTPHLLDAIGRATGGRSIEINSRLIVSNCLLAAKIAKYLSYN